MRRTLCIALALVMAGCVGAGDEAPATGPVYASGEPADVGEDAFEEFEGEATATTGLIRGVVVDAAVVPVVGALVRVLGTEAEGTTNDGGAFLIDDLRSGNYILNITRVGYHPVEVAAAVEAGVDAPPIVKVTMPINPDDRPYIQASSWVGYIQCAVGTPLPGYGPMVCNIVNGATNEGRMEFDRMPDYLMTEMAWEPTQAANERLKLANNGQGGVFQELSGTSPIAMGADEALIQDRLFTDPPRLTTWMFVPTDQLQVVLEQEAEIFTHAFYDFTPDVGWSFVADGPHPVPS